jgi:hypothetical protein
MAFLEVPTTGVFMGHGATHSAATLSNTPRLDTMP